MGEVRVKIRLTNAIDEGLAARGQLTQAEVRMVETEGVVDTGAVVSTIPRLLFERLGLRSVGTIEAWLANDQPERVEQTEAVNVEIEGRRTSEDMLVIGNTVLIGQTLLERLDFLVDCTRQRLIPNPAHGNRRVLVVRHARLSA